MNLKTYDRLALYHQNEEVLFQFILHAFISTYDRESTSVQLKGWLRLSTYARLLATHFPEYPSYELSEVTEQASANALSRRFPFFEKIRFLLYNRLSLYVENAVILLFLVRKRYELARVFGEGQIERLVPMGNIDRALELYAQKGYGHLIPLMKPQCEGWTQ